MSTVLSEVLSGELQSNITFDWKILLSTLIDLGDLWISAIERFIEETVNNLTDTVRQWLRLSASFLHLASSIAGLVIDIIKNNIAGMVVSCGKLITSTTKFMTALDQLISGSERALLPYHVTRNIHDVLTVVKFGMKGIELAYSQQPHRDTFEPLYESKEGKMSSQPALPESGRSRRRPPPIVSYASHFASSSSSQQSYGYDVQERRSPSPTSGNG